MDNQQELKKMYKLFLINLVQNHPLDKMKINKCIETYLDKSIIRNYNSSYSTFSYIYDLEKKGTKLQL